MLPKRQVKELVLYSPQHIARLEAADQFPKRVRLGPDRVGWVEDEVLDRLRQRIAPVLAMTLLLSREPELAAFGEDLFQALGRRVQVMRAILLLLCVLLSAAAVSATGLIGFVGLIAPHIARSLAGHGRPNCSRPPGRASATADARSSAALI